MSLNSLTLTILILFLIIFLSVSTSTSHNTCSSTSTSTCPPFPPNPPFPFSSSPGCGHPSFQFKCSTPHSLISINNISFSILTYNPNTPSILLTPLPRANTTTCTPFPSIPNRSINLSSTPFRISDASCSRLSFLHPCTAPNCTHCPDQCHLINNPTHLLRHCTSTHHSPSDSPSTCQTDVLAFLDQILKSGILLEWDQSQDPYFTNCTTCRANNGLCGFNSSHPAKPFLCFISHSTITPPWIHKIKPNRMAIFSLVIAFVSLLLLVSVAAVILRSARFKSSPAIQDPTALFLHNHRSLTLLPPVFTYEELVSSTNRFDPKRKIGDGGFGSVYLAHLRDGTIAAVKHLHRQHATAAFSTKSFCNEILILSSINHPNLVKLHGYCSDPRGLLLVYDYVPNGTLAEHLHNRKGSLTWQVRLDIALQTALAMEYLHFSVVPPVVHRDITSSNIFVERDMRIKVGDFGLSRLLVLQDTTSSSNGFVWTGPQGTPGYLDPDYHRSFRLTEKSDVYSFGVVLLELISGLRAVDQTRDKREMALADLVVSRIQMGQLHQVLDPFLKRQGDNDAVNAVAELAFRCVAADKDDRPDSKEVVEELKRVRTRTRGGDVAAKD
ncbi:LEAF RUST 10 DISEASE-RESISTANCE LOCUS RECEPTOR-LIKE PROTEIN KINASE-like 1.5 [Abrus precatorius]|uniref:LEAF RUST 10 DISEASE-RESISTANCE LOCUS RECEPTOR-LIKE PROTEIN KINASE-like 1.5 n=1 Tax=Abrus precatorius TaxID=3816 RepID=A0A8B8M4A7_ABRPR|nr:LEAF RUST 10 DISEASE-RESISTANCE LOCUS RECEPTOR-LIKE PROTEIN KINASE-like 1.5 [Abrus precatorius]